jgi:hypothetical protein
MHQRLWIVAGAILFAVSVAGLIVYLFVVGLGEADKIADVVAMLIALVGLFFTVVGAVGHRASSKRVGSAQSVFKATVGGDVTQWSGKTPLQSVSDSSVTGSVLQIGHAADEKGGRTTSDESGLDTQPGQ